jgi:hypothetical protein
MLTKNRFITLFAMSIMALALIGASACGSDTQEADPIEHVAGDSAVAAGGDGDDSGPKIGAVVENDSTTIEPTDPGVVSQGMPIAGDRGADGDMIVVLDGEMDPADGTRLNDDELFPDGESRGGADPLDTDVVHDLPILIEEPQKDSENTGDIEVSDGLPLADGTINPDSCENVLPHPSEPFELKTLSATDSAKSDNSNINTMCIAGYSSDIHEHAVSVALVTMNSDEAAIAHYELLQGEFAQGGIKFDEQRSDDRDWLTATIDQGGIGAMAIVRVGSDLISVHNGPTSDQKQWNIDWMLDLADVTLERIAN